MSEIKVDEFRPAFVYLNKTKGMTFKAIAELFDVNRDTVSRAVKRFDETSSNKDRKRSGRPKTATNDEYRVTDF
jgi:transposase